MYGKPFRVGANVVGGPGTPGWSVWGLQGGGVRMVSQPPRKLGVASGDRVSVTAGLPAGSHFGNVGRSLAPIPTKFGRIKAEFGQFWAKCG